MILKKQHTEIKQWFNGYEMSMLKANQLKELLIANSM